MSNFDPELLDHLRGHLGDDAEAALHDALATGDRLAQLWEVGIDGWLPGATCSLVLTAGERVLRIPLLPWETTASLPTLLAFSGHGGVPVLRSDSASGATLLPRLRPGTTLAPVPEEEAIEACASLILRLRDATGEAPSVAAYLQPLFERPGGLNLRTDVPALARRLLDTSLPPRLLHGDLHHFNVLRSGDDWIAIDPEGVSGDPAYETAAFLRNPVPALADAPDLDDVLRRRILGFSERLGDAPEQIWGWALVRTALCVWNAEGTSPFREPWTAVTHALDRLAGEFIGAL